MKEIELFCKEDCREMGRDYERCIRECRDFIIRESAVTGIDPRRIIDVLLRGP